MKFFDLLSTASSNMLRNKVRTILTIVAIFIGTMTLSLTNGVGAGIKSYLTRQVTNLGADNMLVIQHADPSGTNGQPTTDPKKYDPTQKVIASQDRGPGGRQVVMGQKDIEAIKLEPNVLSVQAFRTISPDYIVASGDKYQVSVSQQFSTLNLDMVGGRSVDVSSLAPAEVTIPVSFVSPLGFTDSNAALGKIVRIGVTNALGVQSEVTATVVGVQQKSLLGATVSYVNTALANKLYDLQSKGLTIASQNQFPYIVAIMKDGLTEAQVTSLKNDLKSKGYDGSTTKDRVNTIFTVISAITTVFNVFGAITLVAASFGIVNTLLMSVQERTREIGLMKALGMSPRKIFTLFSVEAVLIGFWGSLLGVIVAAVFGNIINSIAAKGFLKDFSGLQLLVFPPMSVLSIVLGIMLIAFLAGTLPAFRASRKNPIEALRYE
ncbi:MAG TPA: FtsX-like permease family protein [Patescibacteria group bacterium]|jgi:putative ABC transport system permease protein|nr:FtsX-like permease family protein [Patescibacteria group bacterium]